MNAKREARGAGRTEADPRSPRRRASPAFSALAALAAVGCASPPFGLDAFRPPAAACYDRSSQPETAVVDSHLHARPFGGPPIAFDDLVGFLRESGVRFANVYGIGQTLPVDSPCAYYLDCPGTPVVPSLRNDFANATRLALARPADVHLTLAMTFPDLARPETVLAGMNLLEREYPGMFRWMGEVNLVKQALFANGHEPVPIPAIARWAPFMAALRERNIPIAIHSDLGDDDDPTRYLSHMEAALAAFPDNKIVWMHMGLSRELTAMDPREHIALMREQLDRNPNLTLDVSWRVIDDHYFSNPDFQPLYVAFLNERSDRILPGTDFLASGDKDLDVYREELEVTSRIFAHVDDEAFRNIALGGNYFRLLGLDYEAPPVCTPR